MRIKACIIDDEKPARDEIRFLLQENFEQIEICGEFDNTADAFEFLKGNDCQLLLLDIEMPEETGVDFIERLIKEGETLPYVIFITAYDQFALKAFELDAVDYLLKPVHSERFTKAISKMEERFFNQQEVMVEEDTQIRNILEQIRGSRTVSITLGQGDRLVPIKSSELLYATVEDKNTLVCTTKGKFSYSGTLTELENALNSTDFFRGHKSYLINLALIESINIWFNGCYQVKLMGSEQMVPISRKQAREFKKRLNIQ